ncbi:MAG: UDP-3-O-[3-hydroxymyristoyl] N-acetylglucosamine deacetylase [Archangium gephyra]|uniref:UDP-3-O-acyl-N-acetylglucosamine deacetylase n=1 Tax=Archangium gephyra TaxID=48 RepID=A0A2W5TNQ9_9BACT|nr:MAG: UDP-3-O-[3-hydroxymyristoyl] N-acetylglucosamine deacetylase [Archangium gephyra]
MAGDFEQRTLQRTVVVEGVGLHSGTKVTLRLVPAPANSGLVFVRTDLTDKPVIPVRWDLVTDTVLATTLAHNGAKVATVEHLLAAVSGLGVDNLRMEVDGPELPIMDGSAYPFAQRMIDAGFRAQGEPRKFLVIKKTVSVTDGDKVATFSPSRRFRIDCTIDFKHPLISDQQFTLELNDQTQFLREVARARTFGFLRDVDKMRSMGLARGGSLENAVVVDDFSILNPEGLRYPDEFVRHKLLDALGDIALLGRPVLGALTAYKTGHALNQKLVAKVLSDPANYEVVPARVRDVVSGELELDEVAKVLAPSAA